MLKFNQLTKLILLTNAKTAISNNLTRSVQTVPDRLIEYHRENKLGHAIKSPSVTEPTPNEQSLENEKFPNETAKNYKELYPEFLPTPEYYFRDKIREKLERTDMIRRRKQITIPEFYVGSILAVTASDPYAPEKVNRFVGICTRRDGVGLRHTFTLRNVLDNTAVEIIYELYNPTIISIEVLKLEKRLDENLMYLRDCPLEYSTVPFDMQPIRLAPGTPVPLNTIKIKLNPKPWHHRWDRKQLKGVILPQMENSEHAQYRRSTSDFKPFEKYDLMKNYRETIHDTDFMPILNELKQFESEQEYKREKIVGSRKLKRVRELPTESS